MKILWFDKLKNLCELLIIATFYLYDNFYNVEDYLKSLGIEKKINKNNIKKIIKKKKKKKGKNRYKRKKRIEKNIK